MAAVSAFGGLTARVVPAGTSGVYGAVDPPSPRQPGTDGVDSRAAHAKGSGSDEPATPPRDQRYHRRDRGSDPRGHSGGGAQPAYSGSTQRPADQGQRRYYRQVAGGRLPTRAFIDARPVAGSVSSL